MSKYVVIRIKGTQHRVSEGDEVLVGKLGDDEPEAEVLMLVDGEKIKVGKPTLKDVKIKLKILEKEVKGIKLYVQTFKAKSRYRRKIGFRPVHTKLLVEKIA